MKKTFYENLILRFSICQYAYQQPFAHLYLRIIIVWNYFWEEFNSYNEVLREVLYQHWASDDLLFLSSDVIFNKTFDIDHRI